MKDFYSICKDLQKILLDIAALDKEDEKMEFDFRKLPFEGYELDTEAASSNEEAWFSRNDRYENIHIYVPEAVLIDVLTPGQEEEIVVVEVFVGFQHPKVFILNLVDCVGAVNSFSEEEIYKKVADSILQAVFKDRKLEVYV